LDSLSSFDEQEVAPALLTTGSERPRVHMFFDYSNLFVPLRRVRPGGPVTDERETRLHFANLHRLAAAGRPVDKAICASGREGRPATMWGPLRKLGFRVELLETERRGEQGVDAILQAHMLRSLADCAAGVVVVLTGDGGADQEGIGFLADLRRMHGWGWGIEVLSWRQACSQPLRRFAEEHGAFVALDDYYESITYLVRGRQPPVLSLKRRPLASPRFRRAAAQPSLWPTGPRKPPAARCCPRGGDRA
jgi:hypothetical protein